MWNTACPITRLCARSGCLLVAIGCLLVVFQWPLVARKLLLVAINCSQASCRPFMPVIVAIFNSNRYDVPRKSGAIRESLSLSLSLYIYL